MSAWLIALRFELTVSVVCVAVVKVLSISLSMLWVNQVPQTLRVNILMILTPFMIETCTVAHNARSFWTRTVQVSLSQVPQTSFTEYGKLVFHSHMSLSLGPPEEERIP